MHTYNVFDCTVPNGRDIKVTTKALAHVVAVVMSKVTGRFHDYDRAEG